MVLPYETKQHNRHYDNCWHDGTVYEYINDMHMQLPTTKERKL